MATGLGVAQQDEEEQESLTTAQGLGIAPTVNPAGPVPPMPSAPQEPERRGGKIGSILTGIADQRAAMQGRLTPRQMRQQQALEAEKAQLERTKFGLEAVKSYRELAKDMTPEQQDALAQHMESQIGNVMPGFAKMAKWSVTSPKSAETLELASTAGVALHYVGGGNALAGLQKYYSGDKTAVDAVNREYDALRKDEVVDKLAKMQKRMPSLPPEATANLPRDAKGQPFLSIDTLPAVNRFLPEEERLSSLEMGTIQRNPTLAQQFGIKTPDQIKKQGDLTPSTRTIEEGGRKWQEGFDPKDGRTLWRVPAGDAGGAGMTVELPDGTVVTTGKPSAGQEKIAEEMRKKEIAVKQFSHEIDLVSKRIRSRPDLTASMGALSEAAGALQANSQSMMSLFGVNNELSGGMDWQAYDKELDSMIPAAWAGLAAQRQGVKAALFNLGVMGAIASGLAGDGRMTDKDLLVSLKQIGADLDDPAQLLSRLAENKRITQDKFRIEYETRNPGKKYEGFKSDPVADGNYEAMSDEQIKSFVGSPDYDALTRGEKSKLRKVIEARGL